MSELRPTNNRIGLLESHRDQHRDMLLDLRSRMDRLEQAEPITATLETLPQPTVWRERVQLSHTLKDGWRVSEVTVEVTYSEDDPPNAITRCRRLHNAVRDGQTVAASLNHPKET